MRILGHSHSLTEGLPPRGSTRKTQVWAEMPASEEIIQEALRRLFGLFGLFGLLAPGLIDDYCQSIFGRSNGPYTLFRGRLWWQRVFTITLMGVEGF